MMLASVQDKIVSVAKLRAWKLAIVGPSVFWYFPILYALLTTNPTVNPFGLTALVIVLMISASWGFLLNDLFDREADAKSNRADASHGHGLTKTQMEILILSTAAISWVIVFSIGGGYVFKVVLAVNYLWGIFYSTPPVKLKVRRFWGLLANSLMERPLPILVFLTYMGYFNILTILFPVMMELSWSVFKHQAADVKEDIAAHIDTFAAHLGEELSSKIVRDFLNPLSFLMVLSLIVISWLNIAGLRPLMAIVFVLVVTGTSAAYIGEKRGRVTTYFTSTDPPYIIFLNLAYRFVLLPIMALGVLDFRQAYYPLIVLLGATLIFHGYQYSKILEQRHR